LKAYTRENGQSLVEFAMILPIVVVMALGVIEGGYALLDQHVVTKISREGSNLISRDATLADATAALRSMATNPVDFDDNARLIFSVLKKGSAPGTTNYDKVFLYQRHSYGSLTAASTLTTAGPATFGGAPNYAAANPNTTAALQITNLPENLDIPRGGLLYVTEVYSRHTLVTPLDRFGVTLPDTLYSVAYF
jgi:hypothetical protein